MEYLPSLEERKRRLIEFCTDCGGDDMSAGGGDDEPPTADSLDPQPDYRPLKKTINKIKEKRKQKRGT